VRLSAFIPVVLLATQPALADPAPISVMSAWVRAGPPSLSVYAGYMVLQNNSDKELTVVGVSSQRFAKVEMHKTEIENGIARMVKKSGLVIGPHSVLKFEPGGLHFMLLEPNAPLKLDERIPVRLEFANGQSMNTELVVRATSPDNKE